MLICLMFSVVSFADNIYIVDDGEDEFVPDVVTTTAVAPETTTASSSSGTDSLLGDLGSIEDYLGDFSGMLGNGIDSILSEFENFDINIGNTTTQPETQLPTINSGEKITQSQYAEKLTTEVASETVAQQQETTTRESELPSVRIVNGSEDKDDVLSGSTLTLLVFVAAIVLLILVAAIVLVLLTRRTEYNSSVMDKSTLPSVDKPSAMSHMTNDNIRDDGNDYGNITYWNNNSGD